MHVRQTICLFVLAFLGASRAADGGGREELHAAEAAGRHLLQGTTPGFGGLGGLSLTPPGSSNGSSLDGTTLGSPPPVVGSQPLSSPPPFPATATTTSALAPAPAPGPASALSNPPRPATAPRSAGPASAPKTAGASPTPAPEPSVSPSQGERAPSPSAASPVPAPAASVRRGPAPSPASGAATPVPATIAPSQTVPSKAPVPGPATGAPAAAVPAPQLPRPSASPVASTPSPTAATPAPSALDTLRPVAVPSQPRLAPVSAVPKPSAFLAAIPGPVVSPEAVRSPRLAPSAAANAPAPGALPVLTPVSSAPNVAPSRAPESAAPRTPALSPHLAPLLSPATPVVAPALTLPQVPSTVPSPSALPLLLPGPGPAAQGKLVPSASVPLGSQAIPAAALSQTYPALPPAPPGQSSTLVTLPASTSGTSGVVVFDTLTGTTRAATPQDVGSSSKLFAAPGLLSFVVQTSQPLTELPASAIDVQGGSVVSTSVVPDSSGTLFNVNVNSQRGVRFLSLATLAGVSLANGVQNTQSNTLTIQLDNQAPQTRITAGGNYNSGSTTSPGFTIDFGEQVRQTDPRKLYNLTGTSRSDVVYDIGIGRINLVAYILPEAANTPTDITISVDAGVTTDLVGNPNTAASYTYQYRPPSPTYSTVSYVANSVTGGTVAVAIGAPIVAASLSASGAAAAHATFTSLSLLHFMQTFYLAGRMNVANLPDNFRQVSDGFSWSVLDFRAPWESASSNTVASQTANAGFPAEPQGISNPGVFGPDGAGTYFSLGASGNGSAPAGRRLLATEMSGLGAEYSSLPRRLLQAPAPAPAGKVLQLSNGTISLPALTGGSSQYVVSSTGLNSTEPVVGGSLSDRVQKVSNLGVGDTGSLYQSLWRALFWLAIGLALVTLLTWALVALFLYRRWNVPVILTTPRPQLMLLIFAAPAVAQGAAQLFTGSGKEIAIGVVFVVVIPGLFVLLAVWFIFRHIYLQQGRRAAFVLLEDPEIAERASSPWWSKVLDVVVGPAGPEGSWIALKRRDSRFVQRWGAMFEANRGPPMVLSNVTYEVDPDTGHCNRGTLTPMYQRPLLKLGRLEVFPYQLQGCASNVELVNLILVAILLQSFSEPNSYPQVITLIAVTLVLLLYLRLMRPNGDRTELILAMTATLMTLGNFICGLVLLTKPNASDGFRNRIGIAMLAFSAWALVTAIITTISYLLLAATLTKQLYYWVRPSKDASRRFADVVFKVMAKDEHILARKFADRWMYKSLGVGLFGRYLHKREARDPRKQLREAVTLATLQRGINLNANKRRVPKDRPLTKVTTDGNGNKWPDVQQLATAASRVSVDDTQPLNSGILSSSSTAGGDPGLEASPSERVVLVNGKVYAAQPPNGGHSSSPLRARNRASPDHSVTSSAQGSLAADLRNESPSRVFINPGFEGRANGSPYRSPPAQERTPSRRRPRGETRRRGDPAAMLAALRQDKENEN